MKQPNWREFVLDETLLAEPIADPGRFVVWHKGERDAHCQYWSRVANVVRADVTAEGGLHATSATVIKARQNLGGLVTRLWKRVREPKPPRSFVLPNGVSVEQCGERETDLFLVWPEDGVNALDQVRIQSRWPRATRFQKLGERLFLVAGAGPSRGDAEVAPDPPRSPEAENPRAHAEAILADARRVGARPREATALTDLGAIALNEGNPRAAIASLEEALAIARELGDPARESDVIGNLGMAMLSVGQPERARTLFHDEWSIARTRGDRFAEKVALERLGLVSWNLRDFGSALGFFDQALSMARELGDRHQEASLLWHQGIQHAELGERDKAITRAEESVALLRALGRPQAASYGAYLQKYRMGLVDERSASPAVNAPVARTPDAYLGGSTVASMMGSPAHAQPARAGGTTGPGLLRMALSATKAMAGFASSGFQTAPVETQRMRQQTCAACEHHTGVRCRICGCFTSVKSRLLHEACPIGKWPA